MDERVVLGLPRCTKSITCTLARLDAHNVLALLIDRQRAHEHQLHRHPTYVMETKPDGLCKIQVILSQTSATLHCGCGRNTLPHTW